MTDQAPELLPNDIVDRLRRFADMTTTGNDLRDIGRAADEIERLRALTRPPSERPVGQNPCSVCSYNGSGWCQSWACPRRPVAQVREADIITGAMAIAKARGHDPDEPAPLSEMCTWDNAPVPWWKVFEEEAEACLESVALTAERPEAAVAWREDDYQRARDCMCEILHMNNGWAIADKRSRDQFDNAFQHAVGILGLTALAIQHEEPGREVTPAMIDAALTAWFKSPPSETDQGLARSMKAALQAALSPAQRDIGR